MSNMFISIHAPHTGCDTGNVTKEVDQCEFQSTHPTRGATYTLIKSNKGGLISIHAPHTGCDPLSHAASANTYDFNPRTPHGVRLTGA